MWHLCTYCCNVLIAIVIKNKRNLLTHVRVVHMNEQNICKICQKGSEKGLHEKNIYTDVRYKCADRTFHTSYAHSMHSMDIHMLMHTNELQFTCPICAKKFGRKPVLNLHIRRHQVERQSVAPGF